MGPFLKHFVLENVVLQVQPVDLVQSAVVEEEEEEGEVDSVEAVAVVEIVVVVTVLESPLRKEKVISVDQEWEEGQELV